MWYRAVAREYVPIAERVCLFVRWHIFVFCACVCSQVLFSAADLFPLWVSAISCYGNQEAAWKLAREDQEREWGGAWHKADSQQLWNSTGTLCTFSGCGWETVQVCVCVCGPVYQHIIIHQIVKCRERKSFFFSRLRFNVVSINKYWYLSVNLWESVQPAFYCFNKLASIPLTVYQQVTAVLTY